MEKQEVATTIPAKKGGYVLASISLALGIVAILNSAIFCMGIIAVIPGSLAFLFSSIAFFQAFRAKSSKKLIFIALFLSILGISFGVLRYYQLMQKTRKGYEEFQNVSAIK